jgi:hypothetical protein
MHKNNQFQVLEFKITQFVYYSLQNKSSDYRLEMEICPKKVTMAVLKSKPRRGLKFPGKVKCPTVRLTESRDERSSKPDNTQETNVKSIHESSWQISD